jgi:hypothetical protein
MVDFQMLVEAIKRNSGRHRMAAAQRHDLLGHRLLDRGIT